jgi:hypothetical protein
MFRLIGAIGLLSVVFAPTSAMACYSLQPFAPDRFLELYSREDIVELPEVIVEGVVEPAKPTEYGLELDDHLGVAIMHVDRVWKGDVGSTVAILYSTESADCSHPPPFGERIRFGADLAETGTALHAGVLTFWKQGMGGEPSYGFLYGSDLYRTIFSGIPKSSAQRADILHKSRFLLYYTGTINVPLREPELDALLASYRAKTETLAKQAASDAKEPLLAYAKYLAEHDEAQRALDVYERAHRLFPHDLDLLLTLAFARGDANAQFEPETTLGELEQLAPKTDEWRGKIARILYAKTGKFTDGWKDWSKLKQPALRCMSRHQKFDQDVFDRADLSGCTFVGADFTHASFLGADLGDTNFKDSTFVGAKYDCFTEFPREFDRVAAGMIYAGCSN